MNKDVLRYGRSFTGLSQSQLSMLIGLDRTSISNYENGSYRMSDNTKTNIEKIFAIRGIGEQELQTITEIIEKQRKGVMDK